MDIHSAINYTYTKFLSKWQNIDSGSKMRNEIWNNRKYSVLGPTFVNI